MSTWSSMSRCDATPRFEVANQSCQISVMRSIDRRGRPHHPVEPGEVVVADRVGRRERAVALVLRLRPDELVRHGPRHRVDRVLQPELGELVRLARAGAEPGPPEEPLRLGPAERPAVDRNRHAPLDPMERMVTTPFRGARRGRRRRSVYHPRTEGRRERVGYGSACGKRQRRNTRTRGRRAHAGRARADRVWRFSGSPCSASRRRRTPPSTLRPPPCSRARLSPRCRRR